MNRRAFLKTAGIAAIGSRLLAQAAPRRPLKNFVWLRPQLNKTPDAWKATTWP